MTISLKGIITMLYLVTVFLLTRQFPLNDYSWVMNLSLIMVFILSAHLILSQIVGFRMLLVFICLFSFLPFYAIILDKEPSLVFRFYIISILILFAYFINIYGKKTIDLFIYILSVQALVVISIECYMVINFNVGDYSIVRAFFLNADYGDVYTYGSGFYKVQIKGNALLPVAFMISFFMSQKTGENKYKLTMFILFLSIIFAGNFAFYLSMAAFIAYILLRGIQNRKKFLKALCLIFLSSIILFKIGMPYAVDTIAAKSQGVSSSMGTRYDQYNVLIDDLTKSNSTLFFGSGLGNKIKVKTFARDYSSYIYYELQSVYFLNQLGVLFFSLFVILNVILSFYFMKLAQVRVVYLLYCMYAVTNPYILDTNHIVVIIILVCLSRYLRQPYVKNNWYLYGQFHNKSIKCN